VALLRASPSSQPPSLPIFISGIFSAYKCINYSVLPNASIWHYICTLGFQTHFKFFLGRTVTSCAARAGRTGSRRGPAVQAAAHCGPAVPAAAAGRGRPGRHCPGSRRGPGGRAGTAQQPEPLRAGSAAVGRRHGAPARPPGLSLAASCGPGRRMRPHCRAGRGAPAPGSWRELRQPTLPEDIWKPQKVHNDGIYLVYTRHTTTSSIYLVYTWHIPVI
jgi:hypothetical protein